MLGFLFESSAPGGGSRELCVFSPGPSSHLLNLEVWTSNTSTCFKPLRELSSPAIER